MDEQERTSIEDCFFGDEVEVMVLDIDEERRRISLGIKQCKVNPWEAFSATHAKGEKVSVRSNPSRTLVCLGLDGGIDGLIHLSIYPGLSQAKLRFVSLKRVKILKLSILAVDPDVSVFHLV